MFIPYENADSDNPETIRQMDPDSLLAPELWELTDFDDIVPVGHEQ